MTQAPAAASDASTRDSIAVVVLTHNRVHLLQKCVDNVLMRSTQATREIVIWDNASTDGTAEYLRSLTDPRIRVVRSEENVGQNGYPRAFRMTTAPYLVELDDDVVNAPPAWDEMLVDAFTRLPMIGFLAADLEDDPHDGAAHYRHRVRPHLYTEEEVNGIRLLRGPAGGGLAMTSRELSDRVGGFKEHKNQVFFLEDESYIRDIEALGYEPAVLADLRVLHTGGPYYAAQSKEKDEYWKRRQRTEARRHALKRMLVRVPFVRRLNEHFRWFVAPSRAT